MSTSRLLSERFDWPDGSYVDQDDNPRDVVLVGDWTQIAACHWRGPAGAEVYIPEGVRFVVTGTALWEVDPTWAQHPAAILHTSEPPEGWRWDDGRLIHRGGRSVTIGEFGLSCWHRSLPDREPVPLEVARYLLAWRERGEPCPDCDGTGWSSESNPGTGQGGRDEQVAVPCPRGCPDAEPDAQNINDPWLLLRGDWDKGPCPGQWTPAADRCNLTAGPSVDVRVTGKTRYVKG